MQRLGEIESFKFTTMEDVEELITMSGNARHIEYNYYSMRMFDMYCLHNY